MALLPGCLSNHQPVSSVERTYYAMLKNAAYKVTIQIPLLRRWHLKENL
jgi:hypothetical protein